jgi:hypothetical protein
VTVKKRVNVFLVVVLAFQQSAQSVPESQNTVPVAITLTGNRAVPVMFS